MSYCELSVVLRVQALGRMKSRERPPRGSIASSGAEVGCPLMDGSSARRPVHARRWQRGRLVAAGVAAWLMLFAGTAGAQGGAEAKVAARRMAEEAADHFDAGDYEKARDLFHRAYQLHPAPTLPLWEARALVKLGRLVEAEERYTEAGRYELQPDDPDMFRAAVEESVAEVDKLRKRIPKVKIVINGLAPNDPALEVKIDGRRINPALIGIGAPVDPGDRVITADVHGKEQAKVSISLKERDRKQVELDVGDGGAAAPVATDTPDPEPAPTEANAPSPFADTEAPPGPPPEKDDAGGGSVQTTLGSVTLALGVAGIGTGLVAGFIAVNKNKTLRDNCADGACPPEYHSDLESFRTARTISTIGYVAGAVGVVAGVVLLWTAPSEPSDYASNSNSFGVWLGPGSAGIIGKF
jgi:hypothetical protein